MRRRYLILALLLAAPCAAQESTRPPVAISTEPAAPSVSAAAVAGSTEPVSVSTTPVAASTAAVAVSTPTAVPQEPTPQELGCLAEARGVCPGKKSDGPDWFACLREKLELMTPACQDLYAERLRSFDAQEQQRLEGCRAAVKQSCPDLRRGTDEMIACLDQHAADLSSCQDLVGRLKRKRKPASTSAAENPDERDDGDDD